MDYKLNMGQWNSVFVIPKSVVDKHIRSAGSTQLKVLLWILRYSDENFSVESISKSLFLHISDVKDALQYWIESGVLVGSSLEIELGKKDLESFDDDRPKCPDKKIAFKTTTKFGENDGEYISKRVDGCKDISFIIKEAEVILGDKFSRGIVPVLISFYDNDGLPADVILMVLQYAMRVGKSSVRYIEKVGISWARDGIDTIEKAEMKIKYLDSIDAVRERFEKIVGFYDYKFSLNDLKVINKWFNEWNYDDSMIREAYDRCMKIKKKFILKYMDGIVRSWKNEGVYDKDQLKSTYPAGRNNYYSESGRGVSYNIEDYKNYCKSILLGSKNQGKTI